MFLNVFFKNNFKFYLFVESLYSLIGENNDSFFYFILLYNKGLRI